MGFFSQFIKMLTGRKKPDTPPAPPAATPPEPTTKLPAKPIAPDPVVQLESLPPETVEQQVEQVTDELEAIAQQSALGAELAEESPPSSAVEAPAMADRITAWGNTGQVRYLPQLLKYANSADSSVRAAVALALGKLAKRNPRRAELQSAISVLGKLSGDRSLEISRNAVQALGMIRSEHVKPYLQKALRHPSTQVSQAASLAIKQLKSQYRETPEIHPIKPPGKNIHHHRF